VGIPMESPSKPTMEPVTFPNQAWGRTFSHAWRVGVRFQEQLMAIR
jgi:hypothetical protein